VAAAEGNAVLAPDTKLVELAALARRAALFIGPDTGPLHLAAAVGTPCVGLYGPTRIERCGPYGKNHIALQAYYQGGTRRQRRRADNLAMQAIDVAHVCRACDDVLRVHLKQAS
jgi:ADP-heptose:LPS heptosyltransferase